MAVMFMIAALGATQTELPSLTGQDVVFARGPDAAPHAPRATDRDLADQRVVVLCRVSADGSLTDCRAEQDTSQGEYTPDALRMAATVTVGSKARDGSATAGRLIRLPFAFSPDAQADSPSGGSARPEDAVVALVLDHCLPEVLTGEPKPPSAVLPGPQSPSDASLFSLSGSAQRVPTARGRVYYDHDANYCRVLALPADGEGVRDRLIQDLVVTQRTGEHWRYPDAQKTPIDETSLYLTSQSRGHCTPVLVLDYARRGIRWLDVEVGWSIDFTAGPGADPATCKVGSSKPPPQSEESGK